MSKGKRKSSASEDDDDDEQQLTHTLADLVEESRPRHARRYTAGQFTDGLIGLVRRDNGERIVLCLSLCIDPRASEPSFGRADCLRGVPGNGYQP